MLSIDQFKGEISKGKWSELTLSYKENHKNCTQLPAQFALVLNAGKSIKRFILFPSMLSTGLCFLMLLALIVNYIEIHGLQEFPHRMSFKRLNIVIFLHLLTQLKSV